MDNKLVMLLTNYFNPRATQQIDWWVEESKEKVKVSYPSVVHEYNQFIIWVEFCDQMKVT